MSRDKTTTKFSFQSFRSLKKRLGEFDAIVECNELAIREFLSMHEQEIDPDHFIQKLSVKHSVRVDTVNIKLFASRIRQFYVSSVIQQAEQFFEEFISEYKLYNSSWDNKVNGETDLDCLLRNIFSSVSKGISQIGLEVYEGYEYYRLVRNRFSHSQAKDDKLLDRKFNSISSYTGFYEQSFSIVSCPNQFDKIDFNDFLLCTNIIKNMGYTLCEKCRPDNIELAKQILNFQIKTKDGKNVSPLSSIFKLKNNPIRFENATENLLNTIFGKINEADRREIMDLIFKHSSLNG